ncbi:MAG: hypothetical protein CMN30_30595 [Sandaracinus sp.]|nr:hypothetical protein [Sandaracinus sp.]|tara:strand:+ start:1033 stop:1887 length:855 start_codon:yes stop_codon:yes gene_type:complete
MATRAAYFFCFALSAAALAAPGRAHAQSMGIRYDYVGSSTLSGPGPATVDGAQGHLSIRAGYPLFAAEKRWVLVPGLGFDRVGTRLTGPTQEVVTYGFGASLAVVRVLDERWSLIAHAGVNHQSDLQGYDRRAWGASGTLIAGLKLGERERLAFGFAVSYGQGRAIPAPILRYSLWTELWAVDIQIPTAMRVGVRLHPDLDLGPEVRLGGGGATLYDLGVTLRTTVVSAGVGARYRVTGPVFVTAYVGTTLFHCAAVEDDDALSIRFDKALAPVASVALQLIPD